MKPRPNSAMFIMHSHYSGLEHLTLKHIQNIESVILFFHIFLQILPDGWNVKFHKVKSKTSRCSSEKPILLYSMLCFSKFSDFLPFFTVLCSVSVLMCRFKTKQISFFENSSHLNANIHRSLFMSSESAFIFCAIFCELACYFAAAVAVCPSV